MGDLVSLYRGRKRWGEAYYGDGGWVTNFGVVYMELGLGKSGRVRAFCNGILFGVGDK